MTTSQFARMPLYATPPSHGTPSPSPSMEEGEEEGVELWRKRRHHSTPHALQDIWDNFGEECVITNGHPMSPLSTSTFDSDDQPDTPGVYRTQSFDLSVFDIRKVPPDQIAAQVTLIDLELFKAIRMEEFSNCNWTKKDKQKLAPNIVAFTRRFNHTSFLAVREILNEEKEKARAEVISQFIKIAKKLYELNNIHSLKAVVSALQSVPIYRLLHTWKHVHKKEKATFDKLADFLSDNENRKVLREHMDAAKLPCIPHLGLYLTDLCFLQDLPNRGSQVESICNMIAYCQNSTYDSYFLEPHVHKYLTHVRYIDELQKFFEDDNYKLSLKYEPSQTPTLRKRHTQHVMVTPLSPAVKAQLRTSKSHEDLLTQLDAEEQQDPEMSPFSSNQRGSFLRRSTGSRPCPGSPSVMTKLTRHNNSSGKASVPSLSINEPHGGDRFSSASVESRKASTLPSDSELLSPFNSEWASTKPRSASDWGRGARKHSISGAFSGLGGSGGAGATASSSSSGRHLPSPLAHQKSRGHKKSHSLGSSVLATMFGVSKPSSTDSRLNPSPEPPTSISLLDDSLLDDSFSFTPTSSIGNASSGGSSHTSLDEVGNPMYVEDPEERSTDVIKEGFLKKKSLKHNGMAVSQLRRHSKCWVQLTSNSIVFMEAKPKRTKKQSKPMKAASVMLKECLLKHRDPSEKLTDEQFIVNDDNGNSTRFTAKSTAAAMGWVVAIKEAIRVEEEREREEAERSLIKL